MEQQSLSKNKRIVTLGFNLSQHLKLHYNNLMRHQSFVIVQLFLSSSPQPLFNNGKLTYFEHFLSQASKLNFFSSLACLRCCWNVSIFLPTAALPSRHRKKVRWLSCKGKRHKKFFICSPLKPQNFGCATKFSRNFAASRFTFPMSLFPCFELRTDGLMT